MSVWVSCVSFLGMILSLSACAAAELLTRVCSMQEFAENCTSCDCVNGDCIPPALCACDDGWTGARCELGKLIRWYEFPLNDLPGMSSVKVAVPGIHACM